MFEWTKGLKDFFSSKKDESETIIEQQKEDQSTLDERNEKHAKGAPSDDDSGNE